MTSSGDHVTGTPDSTLGRITTEVFGTNHTPTDDGIQYNASKIYAEWIFCEVVTICLVIILLYVIVALSIFQIRKDSCIKRCGILPTRSSSRNETILTGLTLAAAVSTFLRCFADIDTIFGRYSMISCTYLKKPKIAMAFVALFFGILTYWMRQRMIYGSSQMKHLVNKFTRFFSVGILPGLGFIFVAGLLYFMIQDVGYKPLPPYGCSESTNIVPFLLVAITIVLSQVTLVLLLVNPILKRRRNSSIRGSIKARRNAKQRKLMCLVWKSFTTALVAVLTNLLALAIVGLVPTQVDDLGMVIVDINLTILVFCTIFSNADCKKRLCPLYKVTKSDRDVTSVTTSSTNTKANIQNVALNGVAHNTPDQSPEDSHESAQNETRSV